MLIRYLADDCRGNVEGKPQCADSSWSLWGGLLGNGFCCLVGLTGAYDSAKLVAGACFDKVSPGLTSASLVSGDFNARIRRL
jgi:glucan endo-1,3-alpha-glucosidase